MSEMKKAKQKSLENSSPFPSNDVMPDYIQSWLKQNENKYMKNSMSYIDKLLANLFSAVHCELRDSGNIYSNLEYKQYWLNHEKLNGLDEIAILEACEQGFDLYKPWRSQRIENLIHAFLIIADEELNRDIYSDSDLRQLILSKIDYSISETILSKIIYQIKSDHDQINNDQFKREEKDFTELNSYLDSFDGIEKIQWGDHDDDGFNSFDYKLDADKSSQIKPVELSVIPEMDAKTKELCNKISTLKLFKEEQSANTSNRYNSDPLSYWEMNKKKETNIFLHKIKPIESYQKQKQEKINDLISTKNNLAKVNPIKRSYNRMRRRSKRNMVLMPFLLILYFLILLGISKWM